MLTSLIKERLTGGGFIVDLKILSREQLGVLEQLKKSILLNSTFYLAGGTGLAILLNHRRSVDFDFFSEIDFFPLKMIEELKKNFKEEQISLVEMKKDTLIVSLKKIQTSFFRYDYPLLKPLTGQYGLKIASIEDIAAMKVISIVQRGLKKDFIDLWTIIKDTAYSLDELFPLCKKKYGSAFSESVALKALTYFHDAEEEELSEGIRHQFLWDEIKRDLIKLSYEYFNEQMKKHQ